MERPSFRSRFTPSGLALGFSLFALFLVAALIAMLFTPHGDVILLFRNVLVSAAILIGVLGLLLYLARRLSLPLPAWLRVPRMDRDQDWRLLALSLIALLLPILMLITERVLLHQQ